MAAYADSDDLIARYDERAVSQLARDDGIEEVSLSSNSRITAMLAGASGRVESACLNGDRYQTDDLTGLTDNSLALLKDIVCGLAMGKLLGARGYTVADETRQSFLAQAAWAEDMLEALWEGKAIFNVDGNINRTKPYAEGPTLVDLQNANLITKRTCRYYPNRPLPQNR